MSEVCMYTADYSQVDAAPRLPFRFTLDADASVLTPGAGEYQRFCYTVEGVGSDVSMYADLSHFVLGVCPELEPSDLLSAEVVIDGVRQTVTLGDNVSVHTYANPDPTTGCTGIKFDFGLDKDGGRMNVCFTLARAFAVGVSRLCVKGGQTALSTLSICGPACSSVQACSTLVNQRATVCVPITVTPYAVTGVIGTQCCGAPVVSLGRAACLGNPNTSCTFSVSQELCMSVPVAFGASALVGTASSVCGATALGECACAGDEASAVGYACPINTPPARGCGCAGA